MEKSLTAGALALKEYLKGPDHSQHSLAQALGIGQPSVSGWIRGSRPEQHHREALELLTGIPAASWQTEEERELVARIRAQVADGAVEESRPSQEHAA